RSVLPGAAREIFRSHPSLYFRTAPATTKEIHTGSLPCDRSSAKPVHGFLFLPQPSPAANPGRVPADDVAGRPACGYVPTTTHLLLYDKIRPGSSEHMDLEEYPHPHGSYRSPEFQVHLSQDQKREGDPPLHDEKQRTNRQKSPASPSPSGFVFPTPA